MLNQLDLYPKEAVNGTELLFVNFGDKELLIVCLSWQKSVKQGCAEIYPDAKNEEADGICQ